MVLQLNNSSIMDIRSIGAAVNEELVQGYVEKNGSISNAECRRLLAFDRHEAVCLLDKLTADGTLVRCVGSQLTCYVAPETY